MIGDDEEVRLSVQMETSLQSDAMATQLPPWIFGDLCAFQRSKWLCRFHWGQCENVRLPVRFEGSLSDCYDDAKAMLESWDVWALEGSGLLCIGIDT